MKTPYQAKVLRHPVSRRLVLLLTVNGKQAMLEVAEGMKRIAALEAAAPAGGAS